MIQRLKMLVLGSLDLCSSKLCYGFVLKGGRRILIAFGLDSETVWDYWTCRNISSGQRLRGPKVCLRNHISIPLNRGLREWEFVFGITSLFLGERGFVLATTFPSPQTTLMFWPQRCWDKFIGSNTTSKVLFALEFGTL